MLPRPEVQGTLQQFHTAANQGQFIQHKVEPPGLRPRRKCGTQRKIDDQPVDSIQAAAGTGIIRQIADPAAAVTGKVHRTEARRMATRETMQR